MNGEYYEGDFKMNMRYGQGIHYYSNGDYYEGDYLMDKRAGKGKLTFAD